MVPSCPRGQPDGDVPAPWPPFPLCLPSACSGVQGLGKEWVGSLAASPFPREPSPDPVLIWPGCAKNSTDVRLTSPKRGDTDLQAQLLCSGLFPPVNRVGVSFQGMEEAQQQGPNTLHTHSHPHTCTRVSHPGPARQAALAPDSSGPSLSPPSQGSQFPLRAFSPELEGVKCEVCVRAKACEWSMCVQMCVGLCARVYERACKGICIAPGFAFKCVCRGLCLFLVQALGARVPEWVCTCVHVDMHAHTHFSVTPGGPRAGGKGPDGCRVAGTSGISRRQTQQRKMSLSEVLAECVCVCARHHHTCGRQVYKYHTGKSQNGPSLFLAGGWGHF